MEAGVTFKDYLRDRKSSYDAEGDFVRLATADRTMPDVARWDQLASYLEGRKESYEATEAARAVWKSYEQALKRLEAVMRLS